MNELDSKPGQGESDCAVLFDACTPLLYRGNAFRVTGLPVDASTREIKRRLDDLRHAEQAGDTEGGIAQSFALNPAPGYDAIREATQRLQDPARRIVEELFWFWPTDWAVGRRDPALAALAKGDTGRASRRWSQALQNSDSPACVAAKHNLGVMYQLAALDYEQVQLKRDVSVGSAEQMATYWQASLKWWEALADDESHWSMVAERIRILDDPALTTGFARRLRKAFPEAMRRINATLATRYAEKGRFALASRHKAYMEGFLGDGGDALTTLAAVTESRRTRVYDAVKRARVTAEREPAEGANAAREVLQATAEPLKAIYALFPSDNHARMDPSDAVAEVCLECQSAFGRETRDWTQCIRILNRAVEVAHSQDLRTRIDDARKLATVWAAADPIFEECKRAHSVAEKDAESALGEAQRLASGLPLMLVSLDDSGALPDVHARVRDAVAFAVLQCAILYGNKTSKWQPCISLLEFSLRFAVDPELLERIEKNLATVRNNEKVFGNLTPISSVPSLRSVNGCGFTLYGASHKDPETGSYLATHYFIFFGIPLFPIRRYRVIPLQGGYRFLGRVPLRTFDKWHLAATIGLFAWMVIACAVNAGGGSSGNRPAYRPAPPSAYSQGTTARPPAPQSSSLTPSYGSTTASSRSSLATDIEAGKLRAKELEGQLTVMDGQIESYDRQLGDMDSQLKSYDGTMDSYRRMDMTESYNALVPTYNAVVNKRKRAYQDYSELLTRREGIYEQYKKQIDDVNAKVRQYNTGR
jgi:hypothetical protein